MRMMLQFSFPVETGNRAIKDGTLPRTLGALMDTLKPEAAYFFADHGNRAGMMVFDMKDASEIPSIVEPLFMNLNAKVECIPVMNAADLKAGLEKAMKAIG